MKLKAWNTKQACSMLFVATMTLGGVGCGRAFMIETVRFTTSDGVEIVGDYTGAGAGAPAVLLLHMMPADRTSWRPFAEKLAQAGFGSLAIDFRGHGESTKQGDVRLNYKQFTDADHQASIHDVEAAIAFLESRGAVKIAISGASIGANLTLQYLTEHPEVPAVILLSPGANYRGIKTEPFMRALASHQRVFLAASRDDEYSFETIQTLAAAKQVGVTKAEFDGLGHGTTMFVKKPELMDEVIEWLKSAFFE